MRVLVQHHLSSSTVRSNRAARRDKTWGDRRMRKIFRALLAALTIAAGGAVTIVAMPRVARASSYTYVVNSTGDARDQDLNDGACDGTCTLRGAIEQANHNCVGAPATTTTIEFAIPGSGVRTIRPVDNPNATENQSHRAPLPGIVCPVVIDGSTQGGAGYTGPPLIQLDGTNAT